LLFDCQSLDKIVSGMLKLLSGYGLTITAYTVLVSTFRSVTS